MTQLLKYVKKRNDSDIKILQIELRSVVFSPDFFRFYDKFDS